MVLELDTVPLSTEANTSRYSDLMVLPDKNGSKRLYKNVFISSLVRSWEKMGSKIKIIAQKFLEDSGSSIKKMYTTQGNIKELLKKVKGEF
ncbi:hypothetical protein H6501_00675 [Candidatus Woesearchaeota archaeon]|nr:hypothetical protein [Nanoarchaeota archaeon]MCB9370091.1 hypothetical protein [Candidatus Woesearchaeota archaeon]USN44622.1 MAG: hypothetical protein H6500_02150 [Candidatus Woesearchaeota archaeon]